MAETIAAAATGVVESGIGIVRLSGPAALEVGDRVFHCSNGGRLSQQPQRRLSHGWVMQDGERVDEALAVVMPGPHSYTGEDTVEIHSHGGVVPVRRVLAVVLASGARMAEPGEFTKRAFLNGRMDLSQAEAVIDVIRAKTDRAMAAAVSQLAGGLGKPVARLRERLLEVIAHLEADIDFPELELEVQAAGQVVLVCEESLAELRQLAQGTRHGKLLREGIRVALVGRPNVGKSSLMNLLVRENRSIVTEVPGTTRDVVQEWITLRGIPIVLSDTAGIRATEDVIERFGVERSRQALQRSHLVVLVLDGSAGPAGPDLELLRSVPRGSEVLCVMNKMDLAGAGVERSFSALLDGRRVVPVSARTGLGLDLLEDAICSIAASTDMEESLAANSRHEEALQRAIGHLEGALQSERSGAGSDLISIDIRSAWSALGEITGETVGEDLLDLIFSRFCIGK